MGFRDHYRQFEAMDPAEVSRELRARREEAKRRALSRVEPLDLSGSAWHAPPHPEAVNAATFALRGALNAYPEPAATRAAVAGRLGVAVESVVLGHGAGELLRALLPPAGDVLVAWPGWQPVPELVKAAGGRAVPFADPADPPVDGATRLIVLANPADPTGARLDLAALRALCARVAVPVVVDEALAEFADPAASAVALTGECDNLVVLRSFSKAHALAGLRAGAAVGPPALTGRLAPSGGLSSPALAAVGWAASDRGAEVAARRRAAAAAAHERLAAALARSAVSAARAEVPFAWLSSSAEDGPALAARLAARRVFVAPGRLWGDERHVRAQLRGPEAIDRLAEALTAERP